MLRLAARSERLAARAAASRGRRDSIEILASMLDILLEMGEVSKTKLMNQANLNPLSFQRYISVLERAGVVERLAMNGKTVYRPTPRASTLRLLLEVLLSALNVEPRILSSYNRLLEKVEGILAGMGLHYYTMPLDAPYADLVVECCGRQLPIVLCVEGDALSEVKALLAESEGVEFIAVSDGGCREAGAVKPEALAERLSECLC